MCIIPCKHHPDGFSYHHHDAMMDVQVWLSTTNRTREGYLEGAKVLLNCPGKTKYYAIMCSQTKVYLVKDNGVDKFWRGVTGQ